MTGDAPTGRLNGWLAMVGVLMLLAGIGFGYDQGVIAGALHGIEVEFDLDTTVKEIVTSWVTLGALVGALLAGPAADRAGRRATIIASSAILVAGSVIEAVAPGAGVLIVGRLVVGVGVGVVSVAAPLYAAEMAPARWRGRFVSLYQLAITLGILIADAADQALIGGMSGGPSSACRPCPASPSSSPPGPCPTRHGGCSRPVAGPRRPTP